MDQEIVNSLRQAASDIKEGKLKAARTILVDLLRENPEIDQAWYMLSFTVPVVERQVYALEQALKVNPENEKALKRLRKLQGEEEPPKDAFSFKTPKRGKADKEQVAAFVPEEEDTGADLLSKRLLGDEEEAAEEAPEPPAPQPDLDAAPFEESPDAEVKPFQEEEAPQAAEKKPKKDRGEKYRKKVFGIRRSIFLLVMLILIFISLGILGYSQEISQFIAGVQGGGTATEMAGDAGDDGGDGGAALGGEPTEEPTATTGIDLPPVWTATPTLPATPTQEPEDQSSQLSSTIIDFSNLAAPQEEVLNDFEAIRNQLSAMMAEVEIPALNGYLVGEEELLSVLDEFARTNNYRSQANQIGMLFAGLGLADGSTQTDSIIQNMWADPNGTLVFFDNSSVILVNFETSQFQRYSYAKALVQNYRSGQNPFDQIGIYPMCSPAYESCEILYALTKAEAAFFADMWAVEYLGAAAYDAYNQEAVNWFTVPEDQTVPAVGAVLSLPDTVGLNFIEAIYDQGGLQAVNDLYASLPTTTEQLLHPTKYFTNELAASVDPAAVSGSLGVSWMEVYQGTLGEWKTYMLLAHASDPSARVSEQAARSAAAGWGGDHAQVYFRNSTQEYVVVAEWAWDSAGESAEFFNVFSTALRSRSGAQSLTLDSGQVCYQSSAGVDCLFQVGDHVVWLHAPDIEIIQQLLAAYQ